MAEIKITQQMIDEYRSKPGNSVLLDSAIIDLIKKDIETGKLPKEFTQLGIDAQKSGYSATNSNLFGVGFDNNFDIGFSLEKQPKYKSPDQLFFEIIVNKELMSLDLNSQNYSSSWEEDYYEKRTYNDGTEVEFLFNDKTLYKIRIHTKDENIEVGTWNEYVDIIKRNRKNYEEHFIRYINSEKVTDHIRHPNGKKTDVFAIELGRDIAQDLNNTNFLGFKKVRESFSNNFNKINPDNVLGVLKTYYETTGHSLIYDLDIEKGELLDQHFKKALSNTEKIEDMRTFLKYSGLENAIDFSDYAVAATYWKEYTGRESFEADFSNSVLPLDFAKEYSSSLKKHKENLTKDFVPNLIIENNQISNEYYKSDNFYDIQFGMLYEPIIIKNKTTGIERTLDLRSVFQKMSTIDRAKIWGLIQTFPPEALEDIAIEADNIVGHSGNEALLEKRQADGLYRSFSDYMIFNTSNLNTCIHELGHAIDYNYKNNENIARTSNSDFSRIFEQEISNYRAKGNQSFTEGENGNSQGNDGYYNYCTFDEQEMFAECYTLLMLGDCSSKDTILNHFPNCLKATENLLKEIRKLPDNVRHQK